MDLPTFSLDSRRNAARLASLALSLSAVLTLSAQAQTTPPPITPYSHFQYSTTTSSNEEIDAVRVPAVDSTGVTHYWDVSLLFDVDAEGALTLASGYPMIAPSKSFNSAHFKAGKYIAPSDLFDGNGVITVAGPTVLAGGGSEWTITLPSGSYADTYPNSAVWYVESSIANNPLATRIENAKITSTVWSYGVGNTLNDHWCPNSLLGFSQVGNSITIADFTTTNGGCADASTPQDQVTFTLE